MAELAYRIRNSLYLNITNQCNNHCTFCPKFDDKTLKGHNLALDHEPTLQEIIDAIGKPEKVDEVVFCGFGEPLIRLDTVLQVSRILKQRGYRIRINTDGQANLAHGRNILPELAGLIDCISISLNAHNSATYQKICATPFCNAGFQGVCDFILKAVQQIPNVIASAVTLPGVDIEACRILAISLGAEFRAREYQDFVGQKGSYSVSPQAANVKPGDYVELEK